MDAFINAYSRITLPINGASPVVPSAAEGPGSYFAYTYPKVTARINFSPISRPPPAVPKVGMRINWDLRRVASGPSAAVTAPMAGPSTTNTSVTHISVTVARPSNAAPANMPTVGPSSAPAGPSRVVMIPKPVGEPGHPGSGGFNLEDILQNTYQWTKKDVESLLAHIQKEATRTLRANASYRSQNQMLINNICDKAMDADHWPVLANYDNCWPVRSALKLILKYKSEASRRVEGKKVAACI
ncbi:hypothetical protein CVT25_013476 [Psilocybe cyanescens]|uniref:Uncharacterized protein n=1 Tax=Psilocybe cyanescens TaxID=93625 RepID=A0A409WTN4_PSICY|nr:hypothetical protein CVT25_013476 [Psilocybe cyanescens]